MGCNCGSSSGFSGSGSCNNCNKVADIDIKTPLETIQNGDDNFCMNGIDDEICADLHADKGIHPRMVKNEDGDEVEQANDDCTDLHALNQYYNGDLWNKLKSLDFCNLKEFRCWLYDLIHHTYNLTKGLICAICGLWSAVHCLDYKTRQAVRTITLWTGDEAVFDLPTLDMSHTLEDFDYLDLHCLFGTEHIVARISLLGGLQGVPTTVVMDKIGGNAPWKIDAGAMAMKEVGIAFPSHEQIKINHFIWSISGSQSGRLDVVSSGVFVAFSDTGNSKYYCETQATEADIPHRILKVEGIISRLTDTCIS